MPKKVERLQITLFYWFFFRAVRDPPFKPDALQHLGDIR